jgi:hypothetical protein
MQNWSKYENHTFLLIDFLLEAGCNISKAKKILQEILEKNRDEEYLKKALPKLKKNHEITEEKTKPETYIESDPRGVLLRGRIICPLNKRKNVRSQVAEDFFQKIAGEEDIILRLVWSKTEDV